MIQGPNSSNEFTYFDSINRIGKAPKNKLWYISIFRGYVYPKNFTLLPDIGQMKVKAVLAPILLGLLILAFKNYSKELKPLYSNKAVLLCGPCSGVGEHIALELARQGARLLLVARSDKRYEALFRLRDKFQVEDAAISQVEKLMIARTESKLEYIREAALEAGSPQVEIINAFDFGNVSHAHRVVDKAVDLFGRLDYLVLNHAEIPRGSILNAKHQQTPEFINRLFRVNVYSFIEIALRAMPHLEQSGGNIFVTSSLLGEIAGAKFPLFSSTKHALNGFFYSLQQELASSTSPVGLTIGRFGEIQNEEQQKIFGASDWLTGSAEQCASGILRSWAERVGTYTYPAIHPRLARVLDFILPS